jgi:hypothetical protein
MAFTFSPLFKATEARATAPVVEMMTQRIIPNIFFII